MTDVGERGSRQLVGVIIPTGAGRKIQCAFSPVRQVLVTDVLFGRQKLPVKSAPLCFAERADICADGQACSENVFIARRGDDHCRLNAARGGGLMLNVCLFHLLKWE